MKGKHFTKKGGGYPCLWPGSFTECGRMACGLLVVAAMLAWPTWAARALDETVVVTNRTAHTSALGAGSAASIAVNTLEDELNSDGDCSLREAITAAELNVATDACPAGQYATEDQIHFDVSGTISLASQLPTIASGSIRINGENRIVISGLGSVRILQVESGGVASLHGLSIVNGNSTSGSGGGLNNAGIVEIEGSIFQNNQATTGGGVFNSGVLTITRCLFLENAAIDDYYTSNGGAIGNDSGKIHVTNSSFVDNTAWAYGGGIYNAPGAYANIVASTAEQNFARYQSGGGISNSGTMTLTNVTLSDNDAMGSGNIRNRSGQLSILGSTITLGSSTVGGNGISNYDGNVTVVNTIVAGNWDGDCSGPIVDGGHNIETGTSCGFSPISGSQPNTDPKLNDLADNGGPTRTHAILEDSPALDQANPGDCSSLDQRGSLRRGPCDIGAYEYGGTILALSSSSNPALIGDSVTFTATVSEGEVLTPTGTVDFFDDGVSLGIGALDDKGKTTLSTASLSLGTHIITASYSGDSTFVNSTGRILPDQRVVVRVYLPLVMK